MSEITELMIEAGLRGWADSLINAPNEDVDARRRRCIHAIISAALAARPAPEAGSVVERLEKLAAWADRSQHEKWCVRGDVPIHGYSGEGKLIREAADLLASLSAKVAEVERERGEALNQQDSTAFDRDVHRDQCVKLLARADSAEASASELQREVERLREATKDALGRHQVTHIHAGLRAALQLEGESDE